MASSHSVLDVGSLVQGNANTGTFMFEVMQRDVIRVFVYVPQDAAFGVAPGVDAIVRVPEIPNREFPGKVTRIADALQSGTRTLLTEIDIPNPDDALAPGVYCTVELKIPRQTPSFVVPAEAIIFNRDGLEVAAVNEGKAEIRTLRVVRDFGTWVEADAGVRSGDRVILNPPVNLVDGGKVQLRSNATAPASWRRKYSILIGNLADHETSGGIDGVTTSVIDSRCNLPRRFA
jgi:RND family efflux transporter MFP subunit